MRKTPKNEFEIICQDILNNEKFKSLYKENHHGITRYDHCLHVAKMTYFFLKKFKCNNIEDITKAALLHDFYNDNELIDYDKVDKLSTHPFIALNNAKKYFNINKLQEDIIVNHMFPSTKVFPKTKAGMLVSVVDKLVAVHEMTCYKAVLQLSVALIFLFNIISIQK